MKADKCLPIGDERKRLASSRASVDPVREDVHRFVKSNELPSLDLWSAEFFLAQADKLV
jgi:hypothetical protein